MQPLDERALVLIKFEPQEILFQHRETRAVYRYYNLALPHPHTPRATPSLLVGRPFNRGVIYPREDSDLQLEVEQRRRSFRKEYFSEEEVVNTFLPLFLCLESLHESEITHGSIALHSILIVDGQVRLRDWLAAIPGVEAGKSSKSEDLLALGTCMLSCAFLTPAPADYHSLLLATAQKFSRNFTIALLIFAKRMESHYPHMASILNGETTHIDGALIELYEELKPVKREALKSSPENDKSAENKVSHALSPAKKPGVAHKKAVHHENIENKEEGKKERRHDKNSSIHELMSKKVNEEERRVREEAKRGKDKAVSNLSNFGVENNSRKVACSRPSPAHRLRPFSRRK